MLSTIQRRYISDSCQALSKGSALKLMTFGHAVWMRVVHLTHKLDCYTPDELLADQAFNFTVS
jgi:hypothetical protein